MIVGFGSQIRSYFLHPDQRVKDSRTGHYMGNFHAVLDGNIQGFLDASSVVRLTFIIENDAKMCLGIMAR